MNTIAMAHRVATLTRTCSNRFAMISGSNIPSGSSQMESLRSVMLTKRV
jgi:hypothetical protein